MSKVDDNTSIKRSGVTLPGQPTEEALAEVGSAAGNSLVRGLQRLGGAWIGEWTASQEARAEAARMAIETDADLERQGVIAGVRRAEEMQEMEHQAALHRRAMRLRHELATEQLNLEAVQRRALVLVEQESSKEKSREVDDDWLSRFADLAQKVSDSAIQELWARTLASAVLDTKVRVSAAGLQLLALMDGETAEQFSNFCSLERVLEGVPMGFGRDDGEGALLFDPFMLREAGLIEQQRKEKPFEIFGARIGDDRSGRSNESVTCWGTTRRGYELYRAVLKGREKDVSQEKLMACAQHIINDATRWGEAAIVPLLDGAPQSSIILVKRGEDQPPGRAWSGGSSTHLLGSQLSALIEWAGTKYDLRVR
ncbi:MAG: DUF2806 domain-containing protein [Devosia sp.]|uniref:DUF2806 domain-containing protein n=1 Tax=Devosia sp. TaxID=1871048 RepID=UPI003392E9AA